MTTERLLDIIRKRDLNALFQPIIRMDNGAIIGYEGLIRGPSDSPLHSPLNLFKVARLNGLTFEVEHLCRQVVLERFAELDLPGKLFLNVSPECLIDPDMKHDEVGRYLDQFNVSPDRVIIELTECQPTYDYQLLVEAARHYNKMGFEIAMDDLGEGFSSLRLWSELRPAYVKIDMHFVQGINLDPIKQQFVRAIQNIAESSGALVIAEGIETQAELQLIRELGVAFGQGYHIARPTAHPITEIPPTLAASFCNPGVQLYPLEKNGSLYNQTASKLMLAVTPVGPDVSSAQVYELFAQSPALQVLPVVNKGKPVGLLTRAGVIDLFARPYLRELQGRKPCTILMDPQPLIVDKNTSLQELSRLILDSGDRHLSNGFILTSEGQYLGIGTGRDVMRELTQQQISAARYANPLTFLPGNVPIVEHIERLLESGGRFWACYVDLDSFKPYNDVYGFRKGDDVIQLTGKILEQACDPTRDFLGHIGGDDFLILFQSEDWAHRCQSILDAFAGIIPELYTRGDRERGGCITEDRRGISITYPLVTISLGVVTADPGQFVSHHQISVAAAEAKKQSKKISGNSLFVDRRMGPPGRYR